MPRKTDEGNPKLVRHYGFNEAAARCRGKHPDRHLGDEGQRRFNEAAARCRGKHHPFNHVGRRAHASMRPRPDAAENQVVRQNAIPVRALQ